MQKYRPEARTDTVERFWNGMHGKHLKTWSARQPPATVPFDATPLATPVQTPAAIDVATPAAILSPNHAAEMPAASCVA